jgi:hypothetical protein
MNKRTSRIIGLVILLTVTSLIGCLAQPVSPPEKETPPTTQPEGVRQITLTYNNGVLVVTDVTGNTSKEIYRGEVVQQMVNAPFLNLTISTFTNQGESSSVNYAISENITAVTLPVAVSRIGLSDQNGNKLTDPIPVSGVENPLSKLPKGTLGFVVIGLIAVALGVSIGLVIRKRTSKPRLPVPPSPGMPPAVSKAKLIMQGNIDIPVSAAVLPIGRSDLARTVTAENLKYISKQHFTVSFSNGQYYIEDANSTNGTKLNGAEIKGKGKLQLKDGDIVDVAQVAELTFRVS